jgi:hypothetical protein
MGVNILIRHKRRTFEHARNEVGQCFVNVGPKPARTHVMLALVEDLLSGFCVKYAMLVHLKD